MSEEAQGSYVHRLCRICIRPLVDSPVTPNHITTLRLIAGMAACAAFAMGDRHWEIWGGIFWIVSQFLDNADGELARLSNKCSAYGQAYDYYTDVLINGLVFVCIGIGHRHGVIGDWSVALGLLAGSTIAIASVLSEQLENRIDDMAHAYEVNEHFDFDDVMFIFGPLAWLGWLFPLLIGASIGGPVFAILTWWRLSKVPTS